MSKPQNPWESVRLDPPPARRSARPTGPIMRWFFGLCALAQAIGGPSQISSDITVLLAWQPATAHILLREEPGGSPEDLLLPLPLLPGNARLPRLGMRFTTRQGAVVTVAIGGMSPPWRPLHAGEEIRIRYDPADPSSRVELRGEAEIIGNTVLNLLALWIILPGMIRVARGAPATDRRTVWPPWPFRR